MREGRSGGDEGGEGVAMGALMFYEGEEKGVWGPSNERSIQCLPVNSEM